MSYYSCYMLDLDWFDGHVFAEDGHIQWPFVEIC